MMLLGEHPETCHFQVTMRPEDAQQMGVVFHVQEAVSYTHLDVYKRQVLGTAVTTSLVITTGYVMSKKTLPFRRAIMMFFVITMYFNGGLIPTYLAVSYTHLDVYKRQRHTQCPFSRSHQKKCGQRQ